MAKLKYRLVNNIEDESGFEDTYEIGNYTVVCDYDYKYERLYVDFYTDKEFYPSISRIKLRGEESPKIKIQTTSYGSLEPNDILKVINGYEEALDVVETVEDLIQQY